MSQGHSASGTADSGARLRPGGSERKLSEAYDTALLDLDGVVYAGGQAIAHAVESLEVARDGGMGLAYVTNNALRTPDAVAEHLTELGIPTGADDVITSAQAVARLISEQVPEGARVLVIGGEGLRVALRERGSCRWTPRTTTRPPWRRGTAGRTWRGGGSPRPVTGSRAVCPGSPPIRT